MNWWNLALVLLGLAIWNEPRGIGKRTLLIHLQLNRVVGFPDKELKDFRGAK
jgi:hypothetical protein